MLAHQESDRHRGPQPIACSEPSAAAPVWWVAWLAAVLIVGCGGEEPIRKQRVKRLDRVAATEGRQQTGGAQQRLLAAIVPYGSRMWFFKLLGPEPLVSRHKGEFERFIRSVRFSGQAEQEQVKWTLPDGWEQRPASGLRYATLKIGPAEHGLELTVIPLPRAANTVLDNVNRWRGQLGLQPIKQTELSQATVELKLAEATATMVDLTGSVQSSSMMPPFAR